MRLGRPFPLYNYIGQNGPKMTKNGHKMPKNGSNDLEFCHNMYLDGFYWFPKFWKFSPKIARFLGKKPVFFRDSAKIKKNLRGKIYLLLGKWSNWPKNWYKCTLGSLLQHNEELFWIFCVIAILRVQIFSEGTIFCQFLWKFTKICQK